MQINAGQPGNQALTKNCVVKTDHTALQPMLFKGLHRTGSQHIRGGYHRIRATVFPDQLFYCFHTALQGFPSKHKLAVLRFYAVLRQPFPEAFDLPFRSLGHTVIKHYTVQCPFYINILETDIYKNYYYDVEAASGYYRDGCVFAEEIDIYDRMALNVLFEDGATMNYSLSCYSPDEGFRVSFTGTKGRVEMASFSSGPHKDDPIQIKIITEDNQEKIVTTAYDTGTHGGADAKMLEVLFGMNQDPDPLGRCAGSYEGYLSLAVGDMAVQSIQTGREVDLTGHF